MFKIDNLLKNKFTLHKDFTFDSFKDNGEHYLLEGDNLKLLESLSEVSPFVDLIYIDPPYNTGNNFTYNDRINVYGKEHQGYLDFMELRLNHSQSILKDDGFIMVSIDEKEFAYLKMLMDKIFGEHNFISSFIWVYSEVEIGEKGISPNGSNLGQFTKSHEYILVYAKNKRQCKLGRKPTQEGEVITSRITNKINREQDLTLKKGTRCLLEKAVFKGEIGGDSEKIKLISGDMVIEDFKLKNDIVIRGNFRSPNVVRALMNQEEVYDLKGQKYLDIFINSKGVPYTVKEKQGINYTTVLSGLGGTSSDFKYLKDMFGDEIFTYPKPKKLIKELIKLSGVKDGVILDYFAGSGTTGEAVLELNKEDGGNRQFILCTLNEVSDLTVKNYLFNKGTIVNKNRRTYSTFKKQNKVYIDTIKNSEEYSYLGIARNVTYRRLYKVMNGYEDVNGKIHKGIGGKLNYLLI